MTQCNHISMYVKSQAWLNKREDTESFIREFQSFKRNTCVNLRGANPISLPFPLPLYCFKRKLITLSRRTQLFICAKSISQFSSYSLIFNLLRCVIKCRKLFYNQFSHYEL